MPLQGARWPCACSHPGKARDRADGVGQGRPEVVAFPACIREVGAGGHIQGRVSQDRHDKDCIRGPQGVAASPAAPGRGVRRKHGSEGSRDACRASSRTPGSRLQRQAQRLRTHFCRTGCICCISDCSVAFRNSTDRYKTVNEAYREMLHSA